jgi:hypothetical protein
MGIFGNLDSAKELTATDEIAFAWDKEKMCRQYAKGEYHVVLHLDQVDIPFRESEIREY